MFDRYKYDSLSMVKLNSEQYKQKLLVEELIRSNTFYESPVCPVCEESRFELLSEKDKYGFPYSIVICKACGLIQNNPRVNQDFYNIYYEDHYKKLQGVVLSLGGPKVDIKYTDENFFEYQFNRGKAICEFIEKSMNTKIVGKYVVEIGTGTGGILQYFKKKGNTVFGVDLDSNQIKFGKQKGLDVVVGTIKDVKGEPDVVIYSHVLEHILNPLDELRELRKHLTKNSIVYIEVPGLKGLENAYNHDFLNYLGIGHVYYYTFTTLKNLLRKVGFYSFCGHDETIFSIWKLGFTYSSYESDYESTMTFLAKMEEKRKRIFTAHKVKSRIFVFLVKLSVITHTFGITRKVYRFIKYDILKGTFRGHPKC